jgi:excisionase family DNA binding protein
MEKLKHDITKLLSINEYAELMGVSRRTVYNWMADKERKLNVITISGKQFIKLD